MFGGKGTRKGSVKSEFCWVLLLCLLLFVMFQGQSQRRKGNFEYEISQLSVGDMSVACF